MTNKNNKSKLEKKTGMFCNMNVGEWVILFTFTPFLYYGIIASEYNGNWNFKKWPEIREQQRFQEELKIENEGRNYFQKYDSNKDGILDSNEFIKYYKEKK